MFFDPDITLILRDAFPWAGGFFRVVTELGSEAFYIGLILIGFWCYKKRESIVLAFVLLGAAVLNYMLKVAIANPRPDPSYWYEGLEANNYSTPSGHAQLSGTIYSWFALKAKTWWGFLLAAVLIFLVGISRVYLGVHYLGDVLLGWGIGIATATVAYFIQKPLETRLERFKEEYLYLALFVAAFFLTTIMTYLVPLPPGDNFGALGGMLMGIAIGLPLEKRYVSFDVNPADGKKWRLVARSVIGLVLVIGLLMGLSVILPSANIWLRAIRYSIAIFFGVFIWPAIFTKARI